MTFWLALKRLARGFIFIALASSVLLLSDWNQRKTDAGRMPRVAVLQHASMELLDEAVQGMLDALTDAGYRDGQNIVLTRFNAENDLPTDNAIAKEITDGKFELVSQPVRCRRKPSPMRIKQERPYTFSGLWPIRSVQASESAGKPRWIIHDISWASARSCRWRPTSNWRGECSPD